MRDSDASGSRFLRLNTNTQYLMSKQPLNYQSPAVQVIDLCAQGVMCQSPSWGSKNDAGIIGDEEDDRIYSY